MQINVTINDKLVTWDVKKDEFLVDTLRSHGLLSVKKACDTSCCGLCTVWLEDKPVLSCSILSLRIHGKKITTIEGVPKEAEEFARVLQEIIHYLTGNLCRCTGYMGQLRAVKTYLGVL